MFRIIFLTLWVFAIQTTSVSGQSYTVEEAKKSFRANGDKIRKGDTIAKNEFVTVKEKGNMTININIQALLKLKPGTHDIDSLSRDLVFRYDRHVRLTTELNKRGLLSCNFKYEKWVVPGSSRHYEVDRIAVDDDKTLVVRKKSSSLLTLKWTNPDRKYSGKYIVILRDAFNNGFIDVIETEEESLTFDPRKYSHQYMLYFVKAEDCRASLTYKIEVK
ncbi:MAG: hypothetical protein ABJP45_07035 [Cyclobacteriaceae bacterium]